MANIKNLPDIKGNETISSSWSRLLTRDRNISTLFAGDEFITGLGIDDVGTPNWRTDLNQLWIWDGDKFINPFLVTDLTQIPYSTDNPDIPEGANTLKGIIDALVNRNLLNTITLPAEGVTYTADGTTGSFNLPRTTTNKYSLFVFIDGVKQESSAYDLAEDNKSIIFKVLPTRGETIEIVQHASLTEWDYSPNIQYFTGDGSTKVFMLDFDVLRPEVVSVNVAGMELQKNQFEVTDTNKITLVTAPANGASVQITVVGKTSFLTVSPNSIGTNELKAGSVTIEKLGDGILFNMNMIPTGGITAAKIGTGAVTEVKLAENSVINNKIVDGTITEAKLSTAVRKKLNTTGGGGDMSDYYTKEEIDAKGYLTEHQSLANYYTKNDIDSKGYLTEHQSLANYYTKNDIDSKGYLVSADLDNYYTKTDIDSKGYLTEHQSLANYYTKNDIDSKGYLTESSQVISDLQDEIGDIDTALANIIEG